MKILYGLAGEGFGHSSRARVVAKYLEKKGHNVKIITYGQAYDVLKNDFDIMGVRGLHLIFERNILKKRRTVKFNLENFSKNFKRWKEFKELMEEFDPDVCVSDMEPIVPVLSNWYDKPLISFDNQHRITNLKLDVPKKYYSDYVFAKEVVKAFVRSADQFIVTSFADVEIKKKYADNTILIPPIIRDKVKGIKPKLGEKILVYLTKENKEVIKTLKSRKEDFVIYGYNIEKKEGNLEFKLRKTFLDDLANCRGIIATAGYTLMSEALYLKKPYLAVPLGGQFEQTLNALFLKKAGFGNFTDELTKTDIDGFLVKLEHYRKNLKDYNPNYNIIYRVFDKTLELINKRGKNNG